MPRWRIFSRSACGTPVQAILDQNTWLGWPGSVRIGQNMAKNVPRAMKPMQNCWLQSPPEAPREVKDPWNRPQLVPELPLIDEVRVRGVFLSFLFLIPLSAAELWTACSQSGHGGIHPPNHWAEMPFQNLRNSKRLGQWCKNCCKDPNNPKKQCGGTDKMVGRTDRMTDRPTPWVIELRARN